MYHIIMYDIQEDKMRLKLAKLLEQRGLIRIQMSVFIGQIEGKNLRMLELEIDKKVREHCQIADKILILQITQEHLEQARWIGDKHIAIDELMGKVNELFF